MTIIVIRKAKYEDQKEMMQIHNNSEYEDLSMLYLHCFIRELTGQVRILFIYQHNRVSTFILRRHNFNLKIMASSKNLLQKYKWTIMAIHFFIRN